MGVAKEGYKGTGGWDKWRDSGDSGDFGGTGGNMAFPRGFRHPMLTGN